MRRFAGTELDRILSNPISRGALLQKKYFFTAPHGHFLQRAFQFASAAE
jgi:hypothetical protein